MSVSKPATHTDRIHKVPRETQWGNVRENQALSEAHRKPKFITLPSGAKIPTPKKKR